MRYGLDISPAGPWGEPGRIAELAALAEFSGWDGVFCEDYVAFPDGLDTYDPWITLALAAQATRRITLGTMVTPLARRRPWTLAAQAMTVDRLSGGRLVLGVGTGDPDSADLRSFGEEPDARRRAELLDEGLEVLSQLWASDSATFQGKHFAVRDAPLRPAPVQQPRIPIWVGGALTKRRPRERALRWDGACLYRVSPPDWADVTADDVAWLRELARNRRTDGDAFVIAVGGRERADDLTAERQYVTGLRGAGATWWHEYVPPRLPLETARQLIETGPIRADGD